jgi:type II secretory pathway component PulK
VKARRGEEGYALVAAVASIALFASLSLAVMTAAKVQIGDGTAESAAARAAAAADSGVTLALQGLLAREDTDRWSIDGRRYDFALRQAQVSVSIEDERGKVPVALLEEPTATALLEAAGLSGDRLRIARDSLLDWMDDDDEPRPFGAEADDYAQNDVRPRNGAPQSLEELGLIRGFDAALIERLRRITSIYFNSGSFDVRYAQPEAIRILYGSGEDTPQSIARQRELSGQQTAIAFTTPESQLIGRPLTIVSVARTDDGGQAVRRAVVQLTGVPIRPYVIRAYF